MASLGLRAAAAADLFASLARLLSPVLDVLRRPDASPPAVLGVVIAKMQVQVQALKRKLNAPVGNGHTRVAAMRLLTCGSFSTLQTMRRRLSTRLADKCFCAIRRNFSSISVSVIGFLKCPR